MSKFHAPIPKGTPQLVDESFLSEYIKGLKDRGQYAIAEAIQSSFDDARPAEEDLEAWLEAEIAHRAPSTPNAVLMPQRLTTEMEIALKNVLEGRTLRGHNWTFQHLWQALLEAAPRLENPNAD
jgi:hypothetical protein